MPISYTYTLHIRSCYNLNPKFTQYDEAWPKLCCKLYFFKKTAKLSNTKELYGTKNMK